MRTTIRKCVFVFSLMAFGTSIVGGQALDQLKKPEPTEPEIFTLVGEFVRIAYNNEGFSSLGYRIANESTGQDWMLLEVGLSLRTPTPNQKLTRDALSVTLPDGSIVPLATQKEFAEAGHLRALNARGDMSRDSLNYFPATANRPCAVGFFSDPQNRVRTLAYDQVELSSQSACVGRIFFKIPGGIQTGQHYLNVKFENSTLQVPFRILTEEEGKEFKKKWKDIKKQHDAEIQESQTKK